MQEAFAAKAFGNNYGRPVIGWPDDFERLGRREVRRPPHSSVVPKHVASTQRCRFESAIQTQRLTLNLTDCRSQTSTGDTMGPRR